ncbi:MAG: HAD family hydrolase [Candidatus Bathyarchaeota archaeon]|nr:MAG: HAD family hydrolase [Candidatus Bathyarchaeota archaeon]
MIKAVVFDVDGVLIDSSEVIVNAYQSTARKLRLNVPSRQEILDLMGRPLEEITRTLWPNSDTQLYMKEFRSLFMGENLVIPRIDGAPNAIQEIKKPGVKLGLVTGKIRYFVEKHLNEAGFDLTMFEVIAPFEATQKHKPNPEPLLYVINNLHVTSEETVYVGDAISDYECAKNARVRYIAVLTGSMKRAELEELGVKNIIESVADLPEFLKENINQP